jgi:hypothetical protein
MSGSAPGTTPWHSGGRTHRTRTAFYYRARHDPSRVCLALYDRAADAVCASHQGSLLAPSNTALLADMLEVYNFGLIDDTV